MNEVPDETVVLFVDGCMAGEALIAFEARLAKDPLLAERVATHRWIARQIATAHGAPPETAFDKSHIARLGLSDDNVFTISDGSRSLARRRMVWGTAIGSIAASLVVGIFVGQAMFTPGTAMITNTGGRPFASGVLADGLSKQLAGDAGAVRIGVSFRTQNGICRTFRTAQGVSGLGCREGRHWLVPVMTTNSVGPATTTEYRLAGGDVAPSVMTEVDRRIVGGPLTTSQEAQLRTTGWR